MGQSQIPHGPRARLWTTFTPALSLLLILTACGLFEAPQPLPDTTAKPVTGLQGLYFNADQPEQILQHDPQTKGATLQWGLNATTPRIAAIWTGTLTATTTGLHQFKTTGTTRGHYTIRAKSYAKKNLPSCTLILALRA